MELVFFYIALFSAGASCLCGKNKIGTLIEVPFLLILIFHVLSIFSDFSDSLFGRWRHVSDTSSNVLMLYFLRSILRIPFEFCFSEYGIKHTFFFVMHHIISSTGCFYALLSGRIHFYIFSQLITLTSSLFLNIHIFLDERVKFQEHKEMDRFETVFPVHSKKNMFETSPSSSHLSSKVSSVRSSSKASSKASSAASSRKDSPSTSCSSSSESSSSSSGSVYRTSSSSYFTFLPSFHLKMLRFGLCLNVCLLWTTFLVTRVFFPPILLSAYFSDIGHMIQFDESLRKHGKDIIPHLQIDTLSCFLIGPFSYLLLFTINVIWFNKIHRKTTSILIMYPFRRQMISKSKTLYTPPPPSPKTCKSDLDNQRIQKEEDTEDCSSDEVQFVKVEDCKVESEEKDSSLKKEE